ncbi:MAG TPA: undecaprenyldiphospho-muramoylpentapeptide beta-N-acetylglucosaminyltransferase [Spirochaetales bacterium]|nr:undecaprenyldiphospho-muramoylpentapeptide beta-N-acetylglucosaminyltransferase [Spirochaetales bacterium]
MSSAGTGPCVVFTGGGTGGHVYPGLAVAARLRERWDGRLVWIGSGKEVERRAVEAAGIEFLSVPSGKLRRELNFRNLADAFRVLAGYFASRRLLKRLRPALVFSKGGYVSVPPCAAAASLGIPVFTHESDATPGLATRLNARKAERIFVAYEATRERFPEALRARVEALGNPVRADLEAGDAARGRAFIGAAEGVPVILVLGGSQGARQVNALVEAALPELAKEAFVAHQCGEAAPPEAAAAEGPRYRRLPFIGAEYPDIVAAADLVVGRSGAGTLSECGRAGKPFVLVPLAGTGTRGDQVDNARIFEAAGAALVLVGEEATPEHLAAAALGILRDGAKARRMGEASRRVAGAGGDAARAIADRILERIGENHDRTEGTR